MRIAIICLLISFSLGLFAQKGYDIKVNIDGYQETQLFLANNYGDKQYIKDTVAVNSDGSFHFKGDEPLEGGIYLVVMAPNNDFIQIFIDEDQSFTLNTKIPDPVKNIQFEGSKLNTDFYAYMNYLGSQRPIAEGLNKELQAAREAKDDAKIESATTELTALNKKVEQYQKDLITAQPNSLLGKVIKASIQIETPDFSDAENPELARYLYAKKHWFDNIDLADQRFLRAPVMFEKVNYYIEKLTPQHPDSLARSIDYVLEKVKPAEESFKFYIIHFLNKYASSKVVGMDAVYVHMADKYYRNGNADWVDEEQRLKIIENADRLKPILLGKKSPNIAIQELDVEKTILAKDNENEHKRFAIKKNFTLHDVDAKYTVLFIWDPECGHCKKSMPKIIEFYDNYKDKGVELVSLCNQTYKDIPKCAEMIKEKGMMKWINAVDPYIKSRYKQLYDVRTTPQIFVLNKEKEIVMKRIGAEQLSEVIDAMIARDSSENQTAVKSEK